MLIIRNLTKRYNQNNGIHDVNLQFSPNHVYSIIGPNGAGKTTLIKSIAGIQRIDSGTVMLDGDSTFSNDCKKNIGYGLEDDFVYPNMTIIELLKMICEIKLSGKYFEQIEVCLKDFDLFEHKNKLVRECSQGMKKKVGIIISFLGWPKVVLLDEPTNGVDTKGILVLKHYIDNAKEKNSIIIVTSHVLDFVKAIADTNLFIKDGSVVAQFEENVDLEEEYKRIYLNF